MLGHLFEALVTLCVRVPAQTADATVGHLRTRNGDHEIDLVVVRDDGKVLAIEVKLSATGDDRDTNHLRWLSKHLGANLLDTVDRPPPANVVAFEQGVRSAGYFA